MTIQSPIPNIQITKYQIELPEPLLIAGQFFGIDPGTTNLGLAEINANYTTEYCYLYQIKMGRMNLIDRLQQMSVIHSACLNSFSHGKMFAVIEGASYGSAYRQAELAEVRALSAHWFYTHLAKIKVLAPSSIRKIVFGNGKTKAQDIWSSKPPIPNDALAALSCAYAASLTNW